MCVCRPWVWQCPWLWTHIHTHRETHKHAHTHTHTRTHTYLEFDIVFNLIIAVLANHLDLCFVILLRKQCCYTIVPLLLHSRYWIVTLLCITFVCAVSRSKLSRTESLALRCYSGAQWFTVVSLWCYSGVNVVLNWRYSGLTMVLQWCYSGVTKVLLWYYSGVTLEALSNGVSGPVRNVRMRHN
jgi:hypothetical protein